MTELPPEMSKNFGLQSRTFSKGRTDDDGGDRSVWTDTPGSKKDKVRMHGTVELVGSQTLAGRNENFLCFYGIL